MIPQIGTTYNITHPRAGSFVGAVEAVNVQPYPNDPYENYTWVTVRVVEGQAKRLAFNDMLGPGGTIELLTATTEFNRKRA